MIPISHLPNHLTWQWSYHLIHSYPQLPNNSTIKTQLDILDKDNSESDNLDGKSQSDLASKSETK